MMAPKTKSWCPKAARLRCCKASKKEPFHSLRHTCPTMLAGRRRGNAGNHDGDAQPVARTPQAAQQRATFGCGAFFFVFGGRRLKLNLAAAARRNSVVAYRTARGCASAPVRCGSDAGRVARDLPGQL